MLAVNLTEHIITQPTRTPNLQFKSMTFKEIQELIKLINRSDLSEFRMKDGDFSLTVRTTDYVKGGKVVNAPAPQIVSVPAPAVQAAPVAAPAPAAAAPVPAAPAAAPASAAAENKEDDMSSYKAVKSPMVGTFYRSSGPDKPPFVKVGDSVQVGQTVCIVEAMKLFNEIESEVAGKIVKVMVEDAQPVEYDQILFYVE